MTVINRPTMETLRTQINAALESVGTANGVTLKLAGGKFSGDATGSFKLDIVANDPDGKKQNVEEAAYKRDCELIGLKPEYFGQQFYSNGSFFRISGLKLSRYKFPVSGQRMPDGKGFKFTADMVKRGMEAKERAAVAARA